MNVQRALVRALLEGTSGELLSGTSRPWASVTFEGERHQLTLRLRCEEADSLCTGLPDREFALAGHLVADIATTLREEQEGMTILRMEALTIAEG